MENFQKSISFYNNAKITVSQPLMNHSQSFSFGCGKSGASLKDFTQFKSSLNNIAQQNSVKEAQSCNFYRFLFILELCFIYRRLF